MKNFAKGLGLGLLIGYAGIMTVGFIGMCVVVVKTDNKIRNTHTYRRYYGQDYSYGHDYSYKTKKDA